MKIYIDVLFIMNYIFDFIILSSINYILKRNIKIIRLLIGSLIGELSLIIVIFKFNTLFINIFKILLSLVMIISTFGYRDTRYTKKNIIYFYLVSMLLGGGIIFLRNQFNIRYYIILFLSISLYFIYLKSLQDFKTNYCNYYNCSIYFDDNNKINITAFLDTGNKLRDPITKKDIILVDEKYLSDVKIRSPIYVPYHSLNNSGLLTCFKALKIVINGKENKQFLVGVSKSKFYMDGVDCIINNKIMEGLK